MKSPTMLWTSSTVNSNTAVLSYDLFFGSLERNSILEISVAIAALFLFSSALLRPPNNGWIGLLANGLSLQRIRYFNL